MDSTGTRVSLPASWSVGYDLILFLGKCSVSIPYRESL